MSGDFASFLFVDGMVSRQGLRRVTPGMESCHACDDMVTFRFARLFLLDRVLLPGAMSFFPIHPLSGVYAGAILRNSWSCARSWILIALAFARRFALTCHLMQILQEDFRCNQASRCALGLRASIGGRQHSN